MPTVERDEIFHRAQNRTNMQKRSSYKLHEQIEADEQLTTLSRMIRETQRTKETFVYCAVFIELIADSLEHLQSKQIETQTCFLSPTPARMTKTDFTSAVTRTAATSL